MKKFLVSFAALVGFIYMISSILNSNPNGVLEINEQPSSVGYTVMHFVLVESQYIGDIAKLREFSKFICEDKAVCFAMFWDKKYYLPETVPMTNQQLSNQVAHYSRNTNTGHEQFLLCPNGNGKGVDCKEIGIK